MKPKIVIACAALAATGLVAASAQAAPQTYRYAVSHPVFGAIGTYERTSESADGAMRVQAHLNIAVRILGAVVRRESADQTEEWRGRRLMSFQSLTRSDGRRSTISGQASGAGFRVTSPSGTVTAPGDIVASDPWALNRMGSATVVSTRTGKISPVEVIGGERDTVVLASGSQPARHYHVNAPGEANKWEVWINRSGVPIKFRSQETGGAIDFTLVSQSPPPGEDLAGQATGATQ
jgi:hypothetical protein